LDTTHFCDLTLRLRNLYYIVSLENALITTTYRSQSVRFNDTPFLRVGIISSHFLFRKNIVAALPELTLVFLRFSLACYLRNLDEA
jgi:hypothetical protein